MVVPTKRILAEVDVPQTVEVPRGSRTVAIAVRSGLENVSEDGFVLHAPSAGQTLIWCVLDKRGRNVLRHSPVGVGQTDEGVEAYCSKLIAAGHGTHEIATLEMDAAKLKDGQTYTVQMRAYGQAAEAEFVAVAPKTRGPAAPRRSAKTRARKTPRRR